MIRKELGIKAKFLNQITAIIPICNPKSTYSCLLHYEKILPLKWRTAILKANVKINVN